MYNSLPFAYLLDIPEVFAVEMNKRYPL